MKLLHTPFTLFILILLMSPLLHALNLDIKNFSAMFTQTVRDENNKALVYEGKLYAKYPNSSLWKYTSPIQKDIYVKERIVTIVEPDLEQAIIQNINNEVDILKILKEAQQINPTHYETTFGGTIYTIEINNTLPSTILYHDKFDNNITISFYNIDIEDDINESILKINIPEDFDIISQ